MNQENFVRQNWNWADQSDSSFCLTKFPGLGGRRGGGEGNLARLAHMTRVWCLGAAAGNGISPRRLAR